MEFSPAAAQTFKDIIREERVMASNAGAYLLGQGRYQKMYNFLTGMPGAVTDKVVRALHSMRMIYEDGHANKFANLENLQKEVNIVTRWADNNAIPEECEEFLGWLSDCTYMSGSDDSYSASEDDEENSDSEGEEGEEHECQAFLDEYHQYCVGEDAAMDVFIDHLVEWTVKKLATSKKRKRSAGAAKATAHDISP